MRSYHSFLVWVIEGVSLRFVKFVIEQRLCIEVYAVTLILKSVDLPEVWNSPEATYSIFLGVVEVGHIANWSWIVLLVVGCIGMLALLAKWEFVDHYIPWQQVSSPSNLVDFVHELDSDRRFVDLARQLLTIVMAE